MLPFLAFHCFSSYFHNMFNIYLNSNIIFKLQYSSWFTFRIFLKVAMHFTHLFDYDNACFMYDCPLVLHYYKSRGTPPGIICPKCFPRFLFRDSVQMEKESDLCPYLFPNCESCTRTPFCSFRVSSIASCMNLVFLSYTNS